TLPVDIGGSSDTGVALFNPGSSTITLTLRLLDASGGIVGTTQVTLGPRAHLARFASQFFGATSLRGSLALSSSGGTFSALTLRQYQAPLTYTTLPAVSGTARGTVVAGAFLAKTRTGVGATSDTTVDESLAAGLRISGTVQGSNFPTLVLARA